MCCKSWKTFMPFLSTFMVGVLAVISFQGSKLKEKTPEVKKEVVTVFDNDRGEGGRRGDCSFDAEVKSKKLQILTKPRANYTDVARINQTQGTVTLHVTFLANGKIGDVSIVKYLPDGLTEQAIEAAKQIKFEPAKDNGRAVTVTKLIQYTFTLY